MTQVCSVFSQLLQLFSRGAFAQAVKKHSAERNAKGFTCWGQFVAMLFCQVAQLKSLRDVCMGLASCEADESGPISRRRAKKCLEIGRTSTNKTRALSLADRMRRPI